MTPAQTTLWRTVTDRLWRVASIDAEGRTVAQGDALEVIRRWVEEDVRSSGGWTPDVSRAAFERFGNLDDAIAAATCGGFDVTRAAALSCLRLAHDVAMGRFEDVAAGHIPTLRRVLSGSDMLRHLVDRLPSPPATGHIDGTGARSVRFRFPYRQLGQHGRGHRTLSIGEGVANLPDVDPAAAPVVATLRGDRGGWIDLRMLGATLLRPVLAPGRFAAIDIDAFARAAHAAGAWTDNPFMPRPRPNHTSMGLDDVAFPRVAPNRRDAEVETDAMDACLRRSGGMATIDGRVYRRAGTPTILLTDRTVARQTDFHRIAWRFADDIDMSTSQEPLRLAMATSSDDVLNRDPSRWGVPFGLGEHDQVAEVVEACSALAGEGGLPFAFRSDPAARDVDPDAFPARRHAVLEHVVGLAAAGARFWRDVRGLAGALDAGVDLTEVAETLSGVADAHGAPWGRKDPSGMGRIGLLAAAGLARVAARQVGERLEADLDVEETLGAFSP